MKRQKQDFTEKNLARRQSKGNRYTLERRKYLSARRERRKLANGAFGKMSAGNWNDLVVGTTGATRETKNA